FVDPGHQLSEVLSATEDCDGCSTRGRGSEQKRGSLVCLRGKRLHDGNIFERQLNIHARAEHVIKGLSPNHLGRSERQHDFLSLRLAGAVPHLVSPNNVLKQLFKLPFKKPLHDPSKRSGADKHQVSARADEVPLKSDEIRRGLGLGDSVSSSHLPAGGPVPASALTRSGEHSEGHQDSSAAESSGLPSPPSPPSCGSRLSSGTGSVGVVTPASSIGTYWLVTKR